MEVLRNGKFSLPIMGSQLKGLRSTNRNPRNKHGLITLTGAVMRDQAISILKEFNVFQHGLSGVDFPFPQVFSLSELLIICTSTSIYEYDGSSLSLGISIDAYGPWHVADFHHFLYLSNGAEAIKRDAYTQEYSIITSEEVPAANAICNYNGQVLINPNYYSGVFYKLECDAPISRAIKYKTSGLLEIASYGHHEHVTYGDYNSDEDALDNPQNITVDDNYLYIYDISNYLLMVRDASTLNFVDRKFTMLLNGIQAWPGCDYLYGGSSTLYEIEKSTLDFTGTTSNAVGQVRDMDHDDTYLYVADSTICCVSRFNKTTMAYVDSFGHPFSWNNYTNGVGYYDGYLYVVNNTMKQLWKVDASTYDISMYSGSIDSDNFPSSYFSAPRDIFADSNYVYICDTDGLHIKDITDFSHVTFLYLDNSADAYGVYADGSNIYVTDGGNQNICKYDYSTFNLIGCLEYDEYTYSLYGLCGDSNYLYVISDSGAHAKVIRISKSTFTEDTYYDDVSDYLSGPEYCSVDDNYIYVSCGSHGLHRIDKTTMAYVDELSFSDINSFKQTVINSGNMYVANWTALDTEYDVQEYDLSTQLLLSHSPADYPDSDNLAIRPYYIAVSDDYIFTANYYTSEEDTIIKVIDKTTLTCVNKYDLETNIYGLESDGRILYVSADASGVSPYLNPTILKFTADNNFTLLDSVDVAIPGRMAIVKNIDK